MTLATRLDAALCRVGARREVAAPFARVNGLRVLDTGGDRPPLLLVPDGPCVIEHYLALVERLRGSHRVVCADLPGFGGSVPRGDYRHTLREGATALLDLLYALSIPRATLGLSCVNGFYGIAAAQLAPARVERLVLAQTPDFTAMQAWTQRMVPAPIRVPALGQVLNRLTRRRIARGWLGAAVADPGQRQAFREIADRSLRSGGCYCFAGVVQGMSKTAPGDPLLHDVRVPATLLWGRLDRSHRRTDPASIRRHLPLADIVELPTGHFPDLEAPAEYARLLH